eukprot:5720224-Prymnesium_polylepis.1
MAMRHARVARGDSGECQAPESQLARDQSDGAPRHSVSFHRASSLYLSCVSVGWTLRYGFNAITAGIALLTCTSFTRMPLSQLRPPGPRGEPETYA